MTEYIGIILTLGLILLGLLISLAKVELLIRSQVQRIKHSYKTKEEGDNIYRKYKRARKLRHLYLRYLNK